MMNWCAAPFQSGRDPQGLISLRVKDLLSRMTLAEKLGQITLVEKNSISKKDITARFIGGLLSGGGGYPLPNTPASWAEMVNSFQEQALRARLGIPLLYGVDAVHGHAAVWGATVFPHNIGLGAARNPELVQLIGTATAEEMVATGIYWNYAPVVAVPQDIRWGRTYEGFSEDPHLVAALAVAYVKGLQGEEFAGRTAVLATPKHFVGDGATAWGSSTTEFQGQRYALDQGDARLDEAALRAVHLLPYRAAIEAGALCIMVSLSSFNGLKMHAHKHLLTEILKRELGFRGFLVSDWEGIDPISSDYYDAIVIAINAGLDMVMVPCDYQRFLDGLTRAVERGDVPIGRIDDAVSRVLTVKFQLGLFEHPFANDALLPSIGSAEHRALAREAVRQSLVLLKNDRALPIPKDIPLLLIAGAAANDIGLQCGGWTIEWQGKVGDITPGITILDGIRATVHNPSVVRFDPEGQFADIPAGGAEVGIAVVGEMPYAEGFGDRADLALSPQDREVIARVRAKCKKLVVILISGRPMIITDLLPQVDAFVAAWLPGTEGQGVADVLFGDYPFTGRLPYTWPRSMDQLPFDSLRRKLTGPGEPLFPFGFGLTT
jgi:beta-glucosidase